MPKMSKKPLIDKIDPQQGRTLPIDVKTAVETAYKLGKLSAEHVLIKENAGMKIIIRTLKTEIEQLEKLLFDKNDD